MFFAILRIRFNRWFRCFIALACAGVVISWFGIFNGSLPLLAFILVRVPVAILWALIVPILLVIHYRRGNREAGILLIAALCQSRWYSVEFTTAFLQAIRATRTAASNFALVYFNLHIGPFRIDFHSLSNLLYALCLSVIIVLRATRVSRQQALMESELEAARQVQQVILPEQVETVPGYIVESIYKPAQQVGGDFLQTRPTTAC